MDVTILLRRTCRTATRILRDTWQKYFAAAAMLGLAGCSQLPPQYDPINWVSAADREVTGWFGDETPAPPIVEPPPGEGRPFPNLGTVPPPPLVTVGQRTQREQELAKLRADRAAAAKADAALRAKTTPGAEQPGTAPSAAATVPAVPPSPPPPAPSASSDAASPGGAAPAPIIELPSVSPAQASSGAAATAANFLTTSERHGSVSFGHDATEVSPAGRNTLDAAAAAALENAGRVRLVPAQIDGTDVSAEFVERRTQALRQALAGAGLPKDRVKIEDVGTRRVDIYDVYVDY